ncbi:sorbosone dehydrogenase family protein, partial [Klebsiella pneumoniae]|uniref:PQQ-dependent sugar dehydrogenase n=1 Tax=Klebsiella pneumoniae TaxID=573 RepID=UPI0013A5BB9B
YDVSQDLSDLRATICRIDVDQRSGDLPYSIPADNPFIDTPGARPEIWAYGFRNPWRFTVDPETDRVLCGDVGWELWE